MPLRAQALMTLCALPEEKVRVVQMETEEPSRQGRVSVDDRGHAALLAMKSGWPVKIIYDRMEDIGGDDEAASFANAPSHRRQ